MDYRLFFPATQRNKECIENVNSDLSKESHLSGSQIKRYLILHKELDADDGELTRTRKVRRQYIIEKYGDLSAPCIRIQQK